MFWDASYRRQRVTRWAPLMTGWAPGLACQVIVCPSWPASDALKTSGRGSR